MKHNLMIRRALNLALAVALLCLALALSGCKQGEQTLTVRSAWGDGSMSLKLTATKPVVNEAGTRVEFQSVLSLGEIAEAIAGQLPENAAIEHSGGSILLRQTVGEGANAVTDFYFLTMAEVKKLVKDEAEKGDPKGTRYVLSCMDTEFVSPEGRRVRFLFPQHLMVAFGERVPTEALPMDTPMRYNEIGNRVLQQFYKDFGRYNIWFVDGAWMLNGYAEGVDESGLAPMGERIYLKVDGLVNDYTITVSLSPPSPDR